MNKWIEFEEEEFEEWVDEFSTLLEKENPDLAKGFRASYLQIKDTPPVTKWAFWLYNVLLYGNDTTLNSIAWPLNMAFLDFMGTIFEFRGMEDERQEAVVMGRKIMELSVKMYNAGGNDGNEEK